MHLPDPVKTLRHGGGGVSPCADGTAGRDVSAEGAPIRGCQTVFVEDLIDFAGDARPIERGLAGSK